MKILLTGFAPFGGESVNPSYEAIRALPDVIDGVAIVKRELPVEYARMNPLITELLDSERPDAVICVGQAGGRRAITPELVALNLMYGRSPDNAGMSPNRRPILHNAPAAYFSTLPIFDMVDAMKEAGIAAELSATAGTYVCNTLMFCLLHRTQGKIPAGFIHVPYIPPQTAGKEGVFSMELAEIVRSLEICIKTVIKNPESSPIYC